MLGHGLSGGVQVSMFSLLLALWRRFTRVLQASGELAKRRLQFSLLTFRKPMNLDLKKFFLPHHVRPKLFVSFQLFLEALILNRQIINYAPVVIGAAAVSNRWLDGKRRRGIQRFLKEGRVNIHASDIIETGGPQIAI